MMRRWIFCLMLCAVTATAQEQEVAVQQRPLDVLTLEALRNIPEEGFTTRAVPWKHELAPGQTLLYELQAFLGNRYVLCLVAADTPPFLVFTDETGTPIPVDFTTDGNTLLVRFTSPITGAILIKIKNEHASPLPVAFLYAFQ